MRMPGLFPEFQVSSNDISSDVGMLMNPTLLKSHLNTNSLNNGPNCTVGIDCISTHSKSGKISPYDSTNELQLTPSVDEFDTKSVLFINNGYVDDGSIKSPSSPEAVEPLTSNAREAIKLSYKDIHWLTAFASSMHSFPQETVEFLSNDLGVSVDDLMNLWGSLQFRLGEIGHHSPANRCHSPLGGLTRNDLLLALHRALRKIQENLRCSEAVDSIREVIDALEALDSRDASHPLPRSVISPLGDSYIDTSSGLISELFGGGLNDVIVHQSSTVPKPSGFLPSPRSPCATPTRCCHKQELVSPHMLKRKLQVSPPSLIDVSGLPPPVKKPSCQKGGPMKDFRPFASYRAQLSLVRPAFTAYHDDVSPRSHTIAAVNDLTNPPTGHDHMCCEYEDMAPYTLDGNLELMYANHSFSSYEMGAFSSPINACRSD